MTTNPNCGNDDSAGSSDGPLVRLRNFSSSLFIEVGFAQTRFVRLSLSFIRCRLPARQARVRQPVASVHDQLEDQRERSWIPIHHGSKCAVGSALVPVCQRVAVHPVPSSQGPLPCCSDRAYQTVGQNRMKVFNGCAMPGGHPPVLVMSHPCLFSSCSLSRFS